MFSSLILATLVTQALAGILPRDDSDLFTNGVVEWHLSDMCYSAGNNYSPVTDLPCWQAAIIGQTCTRKFGFKKYSSIYAQLPNELVYGSSEDNNYAQSMFSPEQQRSCICQSQWWDRILGCQSCLTAHGMKDGGWNTANKTVWEKVSSSYCAATNTPTTSFAAAISAAFPTEYRSYAARTQTVLSDSARSNSDESLYWTDGLPKAAYTQRPPLSYSTSSYFEFTITPTATPVNGQYVQTATPTITPSYKPLSTGAAASLGLRAPAAAAGALGLAMALL